MNSKLIHQAAGLRTYALIFDRGDEVSSILTDFAKKQHLSNAHFTAIGAFSNATVAWFDWERKSYKPISIEEQVEVLALVGDVALYRGDPVVHAHVVLGKSDGTAHGGHLQKGHVRPTLELILTESPAHLRKKSDPSTGLALIAIDS